MNSNNLTFLPTAASNSEINEAVGPKPRLIFELWGLLSPTVHLDSGNKTCSAGFVRLAMVDIDLPDPTRFELVAGALAQNCLQNATIIFFSGDASDGRVAIARHFPGSIFVPKPFEMQRLLPLMTKFFPNEPTCEDSCQRILL